MPSSLVATFLSRCFSLSFSRRWLTWLHKFWRKGRSICGAATFWILSVCSCISKDPIALKSFLRSTVFCCVLSSVELEVSLPSGSCAFRSGFMFSHPVSLVAGFLTDEDSLTDWCSDVWMAAPWNPSTGCSFPKSELFPNIQLSLSPRGKLFCW